MLGFESPFIFLPLWCFVLALALTTALMEIQIEGGNGWAGCLPSWRFAPAWLKTFLNGKEVTGYHLYLTIHTFLLFHLPILFGGWSLQAELTILSIFFAYIVFEDCLWFVMNPHYGWRSFQKGKVTWYTHWVGPLPLEYYFALIVSAGLAMLRGVLPDAVSEPLLEGLSPASQQLVVWWFGFLVSVSSVTILVAVFQPRISKFLKLDLSPHPGHPGVCTVCTVRMSPKVVKAFAGKKTAHKKRPARKTRM